MALPMKMNLGTKQGSQIFLFSLEGHMQICTGFNTDSKGKHGQRHDEIVYGDSFQCPLCELLEKVETLELENSRLAEELKEAREVENVNER
jgi:hypothetical protein